jgi:glycine cleavage system H protein
MQFPTDYKYSKEHTWLKLLGNEEALIGITEFAQSELGEIVYVDLPSVGKQFKKDEVFGSVEALKTTSDLFMPISGEVLEINTSLQNDATLINTDSYTSGWIIKIKALYVEEKETLMDANAYQTLVN